MLHKKFNKWTIIELLEPKKGKSYCKVKCDCGTERIYRIADLKYKGLKGCNKCMNGIEIDTNGYKFDRHTYETWLNMKARCENVDHKSYSFYGAKGIKICKEWSDFKRFLLDMGIRPEGNVIDRIDPIIGYEKENCRWLPVEENRKRVVRKKLSSE